MMTRAKATKRLLEHHPVNLELARVKVDEADDIIARLIKNHIAALDRRGGGLPHEGQQLLRVSAIRRAGPSAAHRSRHSCKRTKEPLWRVTTATGPMPKAALTL